MHIAIIPGDGIGKEVTAEAVKALQAVGDRFGRRFDFEHLPWSADHYLQTGVTIPPGGYDALRQFDAIFIGALGDPRVPTIATPATSCSARGSSSICTSTSGR